MDKPQRKSLWLKADGTSEEVSPAEKDWRLQEIQAKVGGDFKIVHRTNLAAGWIMLANENGIRDGRPENRRASMIAGQPIVGDVLIVPAELLE